MKRDLLSIADLTRDDIERILRRAESFAEVSGREIKKVPTLRGRTVINLFYESSTRTELELRARRQAASSADLVNIKSAGSSVDKGESLKDTVQTLSAYDPTCIVVRHPHAGAAGLVARWTRRERRQRRRRQARAPDPGAARPLHAAPPRRRPRRPEDLDRRRRPALAGRALEHHRASARMGCEVTVCGPPTLIPRDIETLGCEVRYSLDGIGKADVIYALRMQNERMTGSYVPSLREYATQYQIDGRRLAPHQLLMHPGPVNRGVELSAEVIDSPQALIVQQVESGVVTRMAVLYELLTQRDRPTADGAAPDDGAAARMSSHARPQRSPASPAPTC